MIYITLQHVGTGQLQASIARCTRVRREHGCWQLFRYASSDLLSKSGQAFRTRHLWALNEGSP
jgi:hypothetical protein